MLSILPDMMEAYPRLNYVIASDGDERALLQVSVLAEGLTYHIVRTSCFEEAYVYRLADLCFMPSRGERFGFVFFEALACVIPIAASLAYGSRDAVRHARVTDMVDPDDPEERLDGLLRGLGGPKGTMPKGLAYFGYDQFAERAQGALAA